MQSMGSTNTKRSKTSYAPWLTAAFLAVMIIATAAILAACLFSYVHHGEHVISLSGGAVTSSQATGTSGTGTAKTSTKEISASQAQKKGFRVTDDDQVWSTDTPIELFKMSYNNKNGEIIVKSADGNKVIAPGTDGQYTFSLKNTGKNTIKYKVWMESQIASGSTDIPIETRVSGNSGWILGDSTNWKELSSIGEVSTEEKISAGKSSRYTIYWQWPFERGVDGADTELGDEAADQEISCTVIVHTLAAISGTDGENSDNGNDNNDNEDKAAGPAGGGVFP